jgi:transcription elongation GreA/GreB family factor
MPEAHDQEVAARAACCPTPAAAAFARAAAVSRAFTRESDEAGLVAMPDRPLSPHRNLVTRRGLALIDANLGRYRGELAAAVESGDREAAARAARELRYWTARRGNAELAEPEPGQEKVVFGSAATVARADGSELTYRITGEDEAGPEHGRIAWTTPVARALLGAVPGDLRRLPTGEVEVLEIDQTPEPAG